MTIYYSAASNGFFHPNVHARLPADALEISDDAHAALLDAQAQGQQIVAGPDGLPTAADRPGPTPEQLRQRLQAAVQAHLDATARQLGYDSMASAVSYADEPVVPRYQRDGQALRAWRSTVWADALARINVRGQPLPTPEALLASLTPFPGAPGGPGGPGKGGAQS